MSTRTAYRRLYRTRAETAWGMRAFLRVILPASALPPRPSMSDELKARLAEYGPTGDCGIGKRNADGTGVRLEFYQRDDEVLRARALIGTVVEYDSDWWGLTERTPTMEATNPGWEWLADYVAFTRANGEWETSARYTEWADARMNDAWTLAICYKDCLDVEARGDEVSLLFACKCGPYYRSRMHGLAKGVARFVKAAKRNGINARFR